MNIYEVYDCLVFNAVLCLRCCTYYNEVIVHVFIYEY